MISLPDGTTISARQYLLGALSEPEAEALEHGYLSQPELLEAIAAQEDELIEAFLDGRLDDRDRQAFERFYLASPLHRNRVAVIVALRKRAVDVAPVGKPAAKVITGPWFRHPIVRLVTAAVLMFGLVSLMRLVSRPIGAPHVARVTPPVVTPPAAAAPPNAVPGPSAGSPAAPPMTPLPPSVFAVTLPSLTTRGAGQPTVTIPANVERVTIRLEGEPPSPARPLTATIRTVEGRRIWTGQAERGGGDGIMAVLDVPPALLAADDYVISLSDGDELGAFAFRVARR